MKTILELQAEVGVWSNENFGAQPTYRPLLGIIEELGEFLEGYDLKDSAKMDDAAADTVIYMLDFCVRNSWNIVDLIPEDTPDITGCLHSMVAHLMGKLAHSQLKLDQGIRGTKEEHEADLRDSLTRVLGIFDWCFTTSEISGHWHDLVDTVWEKVVSKRNWKKNTVNGVVS